MFNLSLQNPLDQAPPVPQPVPAAPSTITLTQANDPGGVTVENPQDFTAPIVNENANEAPIFAHTTPASANLPEPSLEEIAADLTAQIQQPVVTAEAPTPPASSPPPPPPAPEIPAPAPPPDPNANLESNTNPILKLAQLMAEREIISQNQIDDVVAHLSVPELQQVLAGIGETGASAAIPVEYKGETLQIPVKDIVGFLAGSQKSISINNIS